ncbi:glycerate kinase [Gracilibacillus ureilyticus]|uniref:Glycerate kinase n=1 Tax=Gracilibacillus ureilyticus TaxID=531814 RepID=A0A1H9PNC3_9BACI|nr:glycerate kinase [Gracilibacillus ureilyticus]SER49647.1 glycerate kinase [Gracilibacillus ureilyticus]
MNIVIAPDSYKGSLSAIEVATIIKEAIQEIADDQIIIKPMADGGEGTIEAILSSTDGTAVHLQTSGPLGMPVDTYYAIIDGNTAIIETALHAGITQLSDNERNPDNTTTYGIGEAINDAVSKGCQSIIVGLGGSATNDGGLGMMLALGMRAYDKHHNELGPFGRDLLMLDSIDMSGLNPKIKNLEIKIACDVDNPLCGQRGASVVYGPQKGATDSQISTYDKALGKYADLVESEFNAFLRNVPGAGAAGGLGFAFLALGGQLESGAKLIASTTKLEEALKNADMVITGEGKSDEQTLYGKAPSFVADMANHLKIPAILLSGSLGGNTDMLRGKFAGCFSIINKPLLLSECMEESKELLRSQTKQIRTLIQHFQ